MNISIDVVEGMVTVAHKGGVAHNYFSGIYAAVTIIDEEGNTIFELNIKGSQKYTAKTWEIPLSHYRGETITFIHQEPKNRFVINNVMQNVRFPSREIEQSYQIGTFNLIERMNQSPIVVNSHQVDQPSSQTPQWLEVDDDQSWCGNQLLEDNNKGEKRSN